MSTLLATANAFEGGRATGGADRNHRALAACGGRPVTRTCAPYEVSVAAQARSIPLVEPVIRAVRPLPKEKLY